MQTNWLVSNIDGRWRILHHIIDRIHFCCMEWECSLPQSHLGAVYDVRPFVIQMFPFSTPVTEMVFYTAKYSWEQGIVVQPS